MQVKYFLVYPIFGVCLATMAGLSLEEEVGLPRVSGSKMNVAVESQAVPDVKLEVNEVLNVQVINAIEYEKEEAQGTSEPVNTRVMNGNSGCGMKESITDIILSLFWSVIQADGGKRGKTASFYWKFYETYTGTPERSIIDQAIAAINAKLDGKWEENHCITMSNEANGWIGTLLVGPSRDAWKADCGGRFKGNWDATSQALEWPFAKVES